MSGASASVNLAMSTSIPARYDAPEIPALFGGRADGVGFRFSRDWGFTIVPAVLVALRVASQPTSAAAYVVASMWALSGRRQAVLALFFCWLFNNTSHVFCGPPLYGAILRYAILFAAVASVFARGPSRDATARVGVLVGVTLLLFAMLIVHSMVASAAPDLSVLKALSFALAFLTALCGWAWMNAKDRERCVTIMVGVLVLVMFASLALVPTGLSSFRRTQLVQGVLAHSQILGVAAAMAASHLTVTTLVERPFRWMRCVAVAASLACLYLSGCRAGLLGYLGGVLGAGVFEIVKAAAVRARRNPRVIRSRLAWGAAGLAVLAVVAGGRIYTASIRFVLKYGDSSTVSVSELEKTAGARVQKFEDMSRNIRLHPLEGIGFGVASDPDSIQSIGRDPVFGLPVIAPVEKGFMPAMIVEELGIPLGALFLGWLILIGFYCSTGGLLPLAVFMTAIVSNFGEASFFSPGGNGLLLIILVCWAATQPAGWQARVRSRYLYAYT